MLHFENETPRTWSTRKYSRGVPPVKMSERRSVPLSRRLGTTVTVRTDVNVNQSLTPLSVFKVPADSYVTKAQRDKMNIDMKVCPKIYSEAESLAAKGCVLAYRNRIQLLLLRGAIVQIVRVCARSPAGGATVQSR